MKTLQEMQKINNDRMLRWHQAGTRDWSVLEWAGAMCGEAGEAANVAKKMLRLELELPGNEAAEHKQTDLLDLRQKLASELGGMVLYAMLLAEHTSIDLDVAITDCFNAKSEAMGFPERL